MSAPSLSCACALVVVVAVSHGAWASAAHTGKPNIWIVVADDLGFGDLGYTGSSIQTPRIDALAKGGVILGHYYVMHCCSPTRSALMTGRYNIRYGLQTQVIPNNKKYGLDLDEKILPEYLNELGYDSHALGKWHLGLWNWDYTPTFRGFDSFLGYYSGSQDYYSHRDSGFDFHLDIGQRCGANCSKDLLELNGNYSTPLYGARGAKVVEQHDPSKGELFLYSAFQSVHCPIQAPARYVAPYMHLDPNRRTFAGMLAALDEAVGVIEDAFKAKDTWDNTLVVFTTDNGGPVGSNNSHPQGIGCATGSQNYPLRGGKGAYFQGGVRGTSFIHGAMLAPSLIGTTSFELMHVTDLVPTLAAAASAGAGDAQLMAPPGKPLDGVSHWEYLTTGAYSGERGGANGARVDLLINIERDTPTTAPGRTPGSCNGVGQYAVIKGQYKLLLGGGGLPNDWYHDDKPYNGSNPTPQGGCLTACIQRNCIVVPDIQLFDVINDESEFHNLAQAEPDIVAELMEVVHKYNSSTYVEAHSNTYPVETTCPYNDARGVLTPCAASPDE